MNTRQDTVKGLLQGNLKSISEMYVLLTEDKAATLSGFQINLKLIAKEITTNLFYNIKYFKISVCFLDETS